MGLFVPNSTLSRRRFVTGTVAVGAAAAMGLGTSARLWANPSLAELSGSQFKLNIGNQRVNFTGTEALATTVNGQLPAPTLRWREGDTVNLRVSNNLAEDSSIHWHGMILPTGMDGVPGLSFAGIKPGQSFDYRFEVNQAGTFWYHSHSGFQEQTGLYGAIVIEPRNGYVHAHDREHVILLSDWTDEDPEAIYTRLKKMSHYYNFSERTAGDLWRDIKNNGVSATWQNRAMWNEMRMSDSDIADVNGYAYTYLMNGVTPTEGWRGLFKPGEKVRLRFINASAMSIFDVRIPGLKMTVVEADGQPVEAVSVDEFRIGTAETYDVIVEPAADNAYCIFAQSLDRTGYTRGTLAADASLQAEVPAMDPTPRLEHRDMGMGDMGGMSGMSGNHTGHDMGTKPSASSAHAGHAGHMQQASSAGDSATPAIVHQPSERGPQVDMQAISPGSGIADPGIGLRHHQHTYGRKVLAYSDLKNAFATRDTREPEREIQLHLTGNMSRYMWSFDGVPHMDAEPIMLKHGERVRFFLVNDTMMTHPIHLHGLWSELETGAPNALPRKHTILVQPGSTVSYLVTADAIGRWAYHCHLQYHMRGMMREVRVT